jgi:hypothetical protein
MNAAEFFVRHDKGPQHYSISFVLLYPKLQIIVSGSQGSQMKSFDAIPNHDRCGQFAATHTSYLNLIRLLLRLGPNASRIVPNETSLAILSQQLGVNGN